MSEKKADLFLFLTAALWGMSIIFTNIAYSENIKTFQMMFFRFFPAAGPFSPETGRKRAKNCSYSSIWRPRKEAATCTSFASASPGEGRSSG